MRWGDMPYEIWRAECLRRVECPQWKSSMFNVLRAAYLPLTLTLSHWRCSPVWSGEGWGKFSAGCRTFRNTATCCAGPLPAVQRPLPSVLLGHGCAVPRPRGAIYPWLDQGSEFALPGHAVVPSRCVRLTVGSPGICLGLLWASGVSLTKCLVAAF